jgi:glycosyltransferase involved in cell wall biosynthesis
MDIIFTVTNDLNYDQRMQRIARTLSAAGFSVELVGFEKKDSIALREEAYSQRRLRLLFRKGKLFYLEYNLRLFWYLFWANPKVFGAIDVDTVWAHASAAKLRGKKMVLDAHEYFSELPEIRNRPRVKWFWSILERRFLSRSKHNYTVSRTIAREFEQRYGQPFRFIPNYPLRSKYEHAEMSPPVHEKLQAGETYMIYQGALNEGRGLETCIRVAAKLKLKFFIAGEGEISEELRLLCKKMKAEKYVVFLGRLEPLELQQWTCHAWLGLNLLEAWGRSYRFSLSNKFFDYVHAHIPQISMAFPEYITFNEEFEVASLIKASSETELEQAIIHLQDESTYNRMKQACVPASEKWCWENLQQALVDMYKQLTS